MALKHTITVFIIFSNILTERS